MEAPHEPIVLGPGEGRTFPFGRRIMITKVDEGDTEDVAIFVASHSEEVHDGSKQWR